MRRQKTFNFDFSKHAEFQNFYINNTNKDAYEGILNDTNQNIYLNGPEKSGKTYLANLWLKNNHAIPYNNNVEYLINKNENIYIENLNKNFVEEDLFYILNHCKVNKLNILITSCYKIDEINFTLDDLNSRLKILSFLKINQPDDDMLINLLTKFLIQKQFIVNSHDIFNYIIKNINRSYKAIFDIVEKLDRLSLEKKRQLTIPLIKEIL